MLSISTTFPWELIAEFCLKKKKRIIYLTLNSMPAPPTKLVPITTCDVRRICQSLGPPPFGNIIVAPTLHNNDKFERIIKFEHTSNDIYKVNVTMYLSKFSYMCLMLRYRL